MKSVLYVVTSLTLGGAETLVVNLSKKLKSFAPTILAMENRKEAFYKNIVKEDNIPVIYSNCTNRNLIANNYKVYKAIKSINPDVIHINDSILAKVLIPIILLKKNKNTIYTIHTDPKTDGKGYRKIFNTLALKIFKIKFVAINELNCKDACKFYNSKDISLIQNGIDLSKYSVDKNKDKSREVNIVHVGRFNTVKNHKFIIEVFSMIVNKYSNVKLHLVGDGPLLSEIEEKSREMKIYDKIKFYGNIKNPEYVLAKSDIFIFPSFYEGSPLSLIEALAMGLPIVASNRGGIPGIVENEKNGCK